FVFLTACSYYYPFVFFFQYSGAHPNLHSFPTRRSSDLERNLQRLADLEEGLYRKRLISYGGLLKEIHKELNLDDAEDGDLIHTDDEEKADEDGFSIIAMWNWERKNYFIKE